MSVTVKQLEAEIEKYGELTALLAGCRSTIHELATIGKRHYERAEQLEGQLTNAVNHLHRAKRRLYDSSFDECIAACNHVLSQPPEDKT